MTNKEAASWMAQPGIMASIHDPATKKAVKTLIYAVTYTPEQAKPPEVWRYGVDDGNLMCKCPKCEGRMILHIWTYRNPYHFCPYCGVPLEEGNMKRSYERVYGR